MTRYQKLTRRDKEINDVVEALVEKYGIIKTFEILKGEIKCQKLE